MRVEDRQTGGMGGAQAGRLQETGRSQGISAASRTGSLGGGEDRLEISSLAGRIRVGLEAVAMNQQQRVAALARQYQAGGYRVDSAALAGVLASQSPEP